MKPGEFEMGDKRAYTPNKLLRGLMKVAGLGSATPSDAGPIRKTTITRGYYILDTKMTADAYCEFLNDAPKGDKPYVIPGSFLGGYSVLRLKEGRYAPVDKLDRAMVSTTTWHGATAYCEWLSRKLGRKVRLPTEAEWEYCARGNEERNFPWGQSRESTVNYGDETKITHPHCFMAKAFPVNATPQKVYDMIGPVAEWCSDLYERKYDKDDKVDPKGPVKNEDGARVLRGRRIEAGYRQHCLPEATMTAGTFGFRFIVEEMPR